MKPRPPLIDRTPEERTAIGKLDAEFATLRDSFVRHGIAAASATRLLEIVAALDELRPEWRGVQYQPPQAERMAAAANNLFNQ